MDDESSGLREKLKATLAALTESTERYTKLDSEYRAFHESVRRILGAEALPKPDQTDGEE